MSSAIRIPDILKMPLACYLLLLLSLPWLRRSALDTRYHLALIHQGFEVELCVLFLVHQFQNICIRRKGSSGSSTMSSSSNKIRAFELQSKYVTTVVTPLGRSDAYNPNRNKSDLLQQLNELKTELQTLRVQKIAGGSASKLTKM